MLWMDLATPSHLLHLNEGSSLALPGLLIHFQCTKCLQILQNIELLLTPCHHTQHGYLLESWIEFNFGPLVINLVSPTLTRSPLSSIPLFHALDLRQTLTDNHEGFQCRISLTRPLGLRWKRLDWEQTTGEGPSTRGLFSVNAFLLSS